MNLSIVVVCLLGVVHLSVCQSRRAADGDQRNQGLAWRRRVTFAGEDDDESSVQTPEDPDGDGVVGAAGEDYPVMRMPPSGATSFDCDGRLPGMYADVNAGCQVYHVCQADTRKESGLCVNGTIFNQETFSCDWWYNVDCSKAPEFYALNVHLGKRYSPPLEHPLQQQQRQQQQQQQPQQQQPEQKAHRHLDIHPERQFLRRKMTAQPLPKISAPLRPPRIILPTLIPLPEVDAAPLMHLPAPPVLQAPPRVDLRAHRKKLPTSFKVRPSGGGGGSQHPPTLASNAVQQDLDLQLPALPTLPTLTHQSPSSPSSRKPQRLQRPRIDAGSSGPVGAQYLREAFDPALHLPRPKPISLKKQAAKQLLLRQRIAEASGGGRDQLMKPMMFPVKSDDTVAGYSDLYLNKPVDED